MNKVNVEVNGDSFQIVANFGGKPYKMKMKRARLGAKEDDSDMEGFRKLLQLDDDQNMSVELLTDIESVSNAAYELMCAMHLFAD